MRLKKKSLKLRNGAKGSLGLCLKVVSSVVKFWWDLNWTELQHPINLTK